MAPCCFPDARLDYKATSKALFRHATLLDELRDIRRHLSSPVNQLIHIIATIVFFAFFSTSLVLFFRWVTLPDPILVFLIILFFPLPYLGFYWYLDPIIAIFWFPFFTISVLGSLLIANWLSDLMPVYAAIPVSLLFACLAFVPELVGHYLLEEEPLHKFHNSLTPFGMTVMTPFFLGYCGLGWMCCWIVRKDTTDQIWQEEERTYPDLPGAQKGLELC